MEQVRVCFRVSGTPRPPQLSLTGSCPSLDSVDTKMVIDAMIEAERSLKKQSSRGLDDPGEEGRGTRGEAAGVRLRSGDNLLDARQG